MVYNSISIQDLRLRGTRVDLASLVYAATQLRVPAVAFGDPDPMVLDLPHREDAREWPAMVLDLPDACRYRLTDAVVHPPFGVVTIDNFVLRETLGHIPFHWPGYARGWG